MAGVTTSGGRLQLSLGFPGGQTQVVALSRFKEVATDLTPFWNGPFKTVWFEGQRRGFATGGLATGGSWEPLTPLYAAAKAKRYPNRPILTASGALRADLTAPDGPNSVWDPGPTGIRFGTTNPIAVYHQHGTSRMEARPPMRMDRMTFEYVAKELQKFMVDAWKKEKAQRANSAKA